MKKCSHRTIERYVIPLFFLSILAIYLVVPLFRFWQYETFYYDFGIYDQTVWLLSRFQAPMVDKLLLTKVNFLSDHFVPSFILFFPFYWVFPKTQEILIIIQSLSVWLAGIVSWMIIKDKVSWWISIILLFSFYYFLGIQNAVITDYHPEVTAILPMMLMFYAIYRKHKKWYWAMLAIFVGFKENLGLMSLFIGLWMIYQKKQKQGILTVLFSLCYSFTAIRLIIPLIGHQVYLYQPVVKNSAWLIVKDFFYPLEKFKTMVKIYGTFGFLPFFYFPLSLAILSDLIVRFCLNDAPSRWTIGMQYNALYGGILFISSFEIVKYLKTRLSTRWANIYTALILISTIFFHRYYHGPFGLFFNRVFWQNTGKQQFMSDFIAAIPKGSTLMTQNNIAVRFTRQDVVLLKKDYENFTPDVIAIDLREGQNPNDFYPLEEKDVKILVEQLKTDANYQNIYFDQPERYIFVKK